jgi:hypothetical protein
VTDAYMLAYVMPAALALLPSSMDTEKARAMLMAIALQESRFEHRQQIGGPARGFWQFEKGGGVAGVLTHRYTADHVRRICGVLCYQPSVEGCYTAIRDNDVLACCFARLLLWTVPMALPSRDESQIGWQQYLAGWRPGKPHPRTWAANFERAWALVGTEWQGRP